jgi:hypothetical protein
MRSLGRDHFRPTVFGIVIAVGLLLAWAFWFFWSELTLYEVSQTARILEGRQVVAEFQAERSLGRIRPGQRATFRLDAFSWVQYGVLRAEVQRVESSGQGENLNVVLILEDVEHFPIDIEPGLRGTIAIEVERISPAALVLRAAGKTATRSGDSGTR